MKTLTKTLLVSTLAVALPFGVWAASEAAPTEPAAAPAFDCPMGGPKMDGSGMGGKHHGKRLERMQRMQQMTPEQVNANLQQRYDRISDPAAKAEFIKNLGVRADTMTQHAAAMKAFADTHQ